MKTKYKILILASKKSENKEKFTSYLQQYFDKRVEVVLGVFSDLTFEIETGNVTVELDGRNVNDFDLVYFRNTTGFQSMAVALAVYLESIKVKFFDKSFIYGSFVGDKFTSSMHLAVNGIPVVPSFVCWVGAIDKERKKIVKKFGFPVVAKEVRTQRMERVYLLNSLSDFDRLPKKIRGRSPARYLFQKFIKIDQEIRLLILGEKIGIIHTKTLRNNEGFHIRYFDVNENPKFLNPGDVSVQIREMAIKAAKTLHLQIAGVDICKEKGTGAIYVFEVNRGPGIDYNTKVSQELSKIAEFFSFELDIK